MSSRYTCCSQTPKANHLVLLLLLLLTTTALIACVRLQTGGATCDKRAYKMAKQRVSHGVWQAETLVYTCSDPRTLSCCSLMLLLMVVVVDATGC